MDVAVELMPSTSSVETELLSMWLRSSEYSGNVAFVPGLIAFTASVLLWAVVARRLASWSLITPLVMVAAGLICGGFVPNVVEADVGQSAVRRAIEITLALVLFREAAEVGARSMRTSASVSMRLVGIALPLGVGFAWILGRAFLHDVDPWLIASLAMLLMVTDAAVCAPAIGDRRVPAVVRNSLRVESGFNDGLAAPFVLLFASAAVAQETDVTAGHVIGDVVRETVIGIAVGVVAGLLFSRALAWARDRRWTVENSERLGILALALFAYSCSVLLHGNGFTASFIAAIAAHAVRPGLPESTLTFAEDVGRFLAAAVWFVFGALANQMLRSAISWRVIGYALVLLLVARLAAVAVALIGGELTRREVLFAGWVGPRGLATVLFGLIVIGELTDPKAQQLVAQVVVVTVLLSLILHGVSSGPMAAWVGRQEHASDARA